MLETGLTTAKTFPKFSGKEEDWERFCESFEAAMVANTRYQNNALSLDDDSVVILKPSEVSAQTDADKKKEEEEMRDHDLELYKTLIDSIDVKNGKDNFAKQNCRTPKLEIYVESLLKSTLKTKHQQHQHHYYHL